MINKKKKQIYIDDVRYNLINIVERAKASSSYNLLATVVNYYEQTIKVDGVISEKEFLQLCKDVGIN